MTKNLALGAILGGLVAFLWGAVSWMALPWHESTLRVFKDENAVARALVDNASGSGVYILPSGGHQPGMTKEQKKEAETAAWEKMKKGPFVFAVVERGGVASLARPMILGLVIQIVGAFLFTWLLQRTSGLSYVGRVGFIVIAALAGAVISELPNWNWWGFSTGYTIVILADVVIGWLLAGLVIARLTAPRAA